MRSDTITTWCYANCKGLIHPHMIIVGVNISADSFTFRFIDSSTFEILSIIGMVIGSAELHNLGQEILKVAVSIQDYFATLVTT